MPAVKRRGRVGNQLLTFEDRPMNWDNWDVDMFYQRKPYSADHVTAPVFKEWGAGAYGGVHLSPVCGLPCGAGYRVLPQSAQNRLCDPADWRDHHVLLRVYFRQRINATKAAYEIQFGNVERRPPATTAGIRPNLRYVPINGRICRKTAWDSACLTTVNTDTVSRTGKWG